MKFSQKNNIIFSLLFLSLLLGLFIFKDGIERWTKREIAEADEGVSVSVTVRQLITPEVKIIAPATGGGGGGPIIKLTAGVSFSGYAQPRALVTFKKDGNTMATAVANDKGEFLKIITGLPPNYYIFSLFSVDEYGRNSVTLNFRMKIVENTQSDVFNLFIPPTITAYPAEIRQGDLFYVSGQTTSDSTVFLLIQQRDILKTTISEKDGRWNYWLETSTFKVGEYAIKASAETLWGLKSQFGESFYFKIVAREKCEINADINCDGKVNLTDLSIFLYWWMKKDFYKLPRVDINQDKKINLVDFSILLYRWKKLK